jgi:hypothetical protein
MPQECLALQFRLRLIELHTVANTWRVGPSVFDGTIFCRFGGTEHFVSKVNFNLHGLPMPFFCSWMRSRNRPMLRISAWFNSPRA